MRLLVIGSGGREHALVWKLAQAPGVTDIFCAPGNPGIARIATCIPISVDNVVEIADFAESMRIDLTVVGPELPLTLGLVDELTHRGLLAFGPNRLAAELEASKVFSKSFMKKYKIPTAEAEVVTTRTEAERALKAFGLPVVFKADGLAAGKGVVVAMEPAEAESALRLFFDERVFGSAGDRVLVERFIPGDEISFMVLCDGERAIPLATVKDYKKVFDGERGPNTGGMGSHSPSVLLDAVTASDILASIVQPTLEGMNEEGRPFRGLLFVGIILEKGLNPYVLEYNVRFGDPETQSVLLRMDGDLLPYLLASARGKFEEGVAPAWRREATACLVLTAEGYPGPYENGRVITGIDEVEKEDGIFVFHAGTGTSADGRLVTAGGRVLDICARSRGLSQALRKARDAAEKVHFEGKHFRRDIGKKAMEILMERSGSLLR
ncbi:MAG: phosphoribosylamine--glycine ligase [Thermoanaerobaculia bacterium]